MQRKGSAMPTRKRSKLPAAFGTKSTGPGGPLPDLTSEDYVRFLLRYHAKQWINFPKKKPLVEKISMLLEQPMPKLTFRVLPGYNIWDIKKQVSGLLSECLETYDCSKMFDLSKRFGNYIANSHMKTKDL